MGCLTGIAFGVVGFFVAGPVGAITRSDTGDVTAIDYQLAYEDCATLQLSAALALDGDENKRLRVLQAAALAVLQDPDADLEDLMGQAA